MASNVISLDEYRFSNLRPVFGFAVKCFSCKKEWTAPAKIINGQPVRVDGLVFRNEEWVEVAPKCPSCGGWGGFINA